jgi:hypothetical protein
MITKIEVVRPVVAWVVIAMAHELIAPDPPAQDQRHHCPMQHHPAISNPYV